jgi:hypothetical protein
MVAPVSFKMSKNALLAAVVILLLGGAIAIIASNRNPSSSAGQTGAQAQPAARGDGPVAGATGGPGATPETRRPRPAPAYPELIAEYGEVRTKLSRQIAGNVVTLLDDVMAIGELAASGTGGFGQRGGLMALGGLGRELALNDEQRAKAEELLADFQKRQLEKSKSAIENLRRNPESLMRMMLASDAFSRGEITEDQYKALQTSSQADLMGIMNPLDRQNFQGGRPLADESFRQGMLEVLDPQQAETFNAAAGKIPATQGADPGNIANLPPMDLEKLDKTITSAQTMTRGIQQMMEGLGGLKDLGTEPK